MAFVDRSVYCITRCVGPTRLGYVLSRWAQRRFSGGWAQAGRQEVITEHFDRGLRMQVDRTHHIGGAIYWRGFHSRRLLRCLDQLLRPDMTLIDVGANQGEVTLYAARRLARGKVIAFEPMPDNYQRLLNNVQLNGLSNVKCHNWCLGDERGQAQLFAAEEGSREHRHGWNEGLASLFSSSEHCAAVGVVEVHPLDDVLASLDVDRLDVLKIDVEGAELPVLRGARECLARCRPAVIVEMNAQTFRTAGYAASDVCTLLRKLGYEGFQIDRSGRRRTADVENLPDLCDMLWMPRAA